MTDGLEGHCLQGIRVLDFSRVMAGPYATRLLADFGAEVIKVQTQKTATGSEADQSGYFNTWNRNKKSITLNLEMPEAREIALKLVTVCDLVVENFSPRVMTNWGLTYERLREARPDIILLSMSAMGHTGPWRDTVAFGHTVQSFAGYSALTAYEAHDPIGPGNAFADPVSGWYGVLAILAALEYRERTGCGQKIDLSEYEAMASLIGPALLAASAHQPVCAEGNRSDSVPAAPHGCYRCRGEDRWCVIAVFNDIEWKAFCRSIGRPDLIRMTAFSTLEQRRRHGKELDAQITEWTSQHVPETVVEVLQRAGIAAGVVQNAADLAGDTHLQQRRFFVSLPHPRLGKTIGDRSPIDLNPVSSNNWHAAPELGADNQYVFQELLGFDRNQYQELIDKGVIS